MLTVRTPRIVPSSAAVFNAIVVGNLSQVQILFAESRASPFDVNMSGMSALIVSDALTLIILTNSRVEL